MTAGDEYTHYKGGKYVIVVIAHDATNAREDTEVVVYKSLADGAVYCRDKTEFTEEIEWPDGNRRPRFAAETRI